MARYTLTKNYSEIAETYGVFQNVSGNAEIEITSDMNEAGIILRPFQKVVINQKVYARKIGNAGACSMVILPFQKLYADSTTVPPKRCDTSDVDAYDEIFSTDKKPPMPPLSVRETSTHYLVSVSKDSLKNQNKFLLQFDDKKGD